MTLGARLRAGIGEVSSAGKGSDSGLMGLLRKTELHYIRCVKPNEQMAAFGFEQPRVLCVSLTRALHVMCVVCVLHCWRAASCDLIVISRNLHTFGPSLFVISVFSQPI